jgi:hypothetical protein
MTDPVWVDGVTPVNAANMTKLQTRDEKGLPNGYVGLDANGDLKLNAPAGGGSIFTVLDNGYVELHIAGAAGTTAAQGAWLDLDGGNPAAHCSIFTEGDIDGVWFWSHTASVMASIGAIGLRLWLSASDGTATFQAGKNDGKLQWGIGGNTPLDTNLYRSAASALTTDGNFDAGKLIGAARGQASGAAAFWTQVAGDGVYARLTVINNGRLNWGPGNAAADTSLYRSAVGQLKTDGNLVIGGLGGSSQLVGVGAADSGGAGFRMLRVPN